MAIIVKYTNSLGFRAATVPTSDSYVFVDGVVSASLGLSGSLTRLHDGSSYLVAGPIITINSASNGSVVISSSAGTSIDASDNITANHATNPPTVQGSLSTKCTNLAGSSTINADSVFATILAGGGHTISSGSDYSVIVGGVSNTIHADRSIICGAQNNDITGSTMSFVGGGFNHIISHNASTATNTGNTICGGGSNEIYGAAYSSICGGWNSTLGDSAGAATSNYSFIGGGHTNTAKGFYTTICGGALNDIANSNYSSILGGSQNTIDKNLGIDTYQYNCVLGGTLNEIYSGKQSNICGGYDNTIGDSAGTKSSNSSCIVGGYQNLIQGSWSSVLGGRLNEIADLAGGNIDYSTAGGYRAKVRHQGAWIWADSTNQDETTDRDKQFKIVASGSLSLRTTSGFKGTEVETLTYGDNVTLQIGTAQRLVHLGDLYTNDRNMKFNIELTLQHVTTGIAGMSSHHGVITVYKSGGSLTAMTANTWDTQNEGTLVGLTYGITTTTNNDIWLTVNVGSISYTVSLAATWHRQEGGFTS